MTKKTLKFNNNSVNKKKLHMSKEPIDLMLVNIDQIVVSDKFNNNGPRYFIGYQESEIVKPLCIILPQMTGYIKYFERGGMNMSFLIKNNKVCEKYKQIWGLIKNRLGIKFHSSPVYDKKYLKNKVKEYDGVIKTNFLGNDVPKENKHYICIACIAIDSVMRMDQKNYPRIYLEECKWKIKKTQTPRFINTELDSDSESDNDSDDDFDNDSADDSNNDSDNDSDSDSDK